MADELVTIATFDKSTEAHLARLRLESRGIDCFLDNENVVDVNWLWSTAVGGVRVKVPRSQAEEAATVLRAPAAKSSADQPPAVLAPPCPKCGCTKVYYQRISPRKALWSLLLLGVPLPWLKPTWKCRDCRREWPVETGAAAAAKGRPPLAKPKRSPPQWVFVIAAFLVGGLIALGAGVLLRFFLGMFIH